MVQKHWVSLGLVLLTTVCFGHVVFGDFIYLDDPLYITANAHVLGGLTRSNIAWAFGASCTWAGYWVPLTWLSLQTDASLFGPAGAWGFHFTNLLIHEANVVLFFLVLQRMTGAPWRSASAAAVFAIHPLRVESVAWVTERKDVLSTLFLLLTVAAYGWYAERPSLGRYGLVLLGFFAGLMAKPTLVTLPFALLLLDYWPLQRLRFGRAPTALAGPQPAATWRRLVAEKIPLLIAAVGISVMTLHFARAIGAVHRQDAAWDQRVAVALSGYLGYLQETFWPTDLAVLYPFFVPSAWRVGMAVLVVGGITAGALRLGRREPALVVGWFWFLGTLFPVSGIVQVGPQALADRYTYVPHLGLAVAVIWGLDGLMDWRQASGRIRKTAAALALSALGVLTWLQVWYWQDSDALFSHTLRVTRSNHEIHRALSGYCCDRGDLDRAEDQIAQALDIVPDNFNYRFWYGNILVRRHAYADAAVQVEAALRAEPNDPDAQYLMGLILAKQGRFAEARPHFHRSVESWDSHPSRNLSLGDLKQRRALPHLFLGELALRDGSAETALDHLERALQIAPELTESLQVQGLQGIALLRLKRWREAEKSIRNAVDLAPDNPSMQAYLAFVYARQGKVDLANRAYGDLLGRFPAWATQADAEALKLVTDTRHWDAKTAEELTWEVCEATGFKEARWLNTRAAVQAAGRDFAAARATAQKALALTTEPALVAELRQRLQLYERDQALPVLKDETKRE